LTTYGSALEAFTDLVPAYKYRSWTPLQFSFGYSRQEVQAFEDAKALSAKRAGNRLKAYLIPGELERVKAQLALKRSRGNSIRFGYEKAGRGVGGERGDFCLVGGVVTGRKLTVFYRSLDLIGGFIGDLAVFRHVIDELDLRTNVIEVWAVRAEVSALKGNTNESIYAKVLKLGGNGL
jgi:hypothetical protein